MSEKEYMGGEFTDVPNEHYKKFFERFVEINSLELIQWKPVHLIGYFCKRYQEFYKTPYKFKFNSSSPSKCFEIFQIKKLAMALSSDPTILKDYIDWVYETRVRKAKRKLTSISFLNVEDLVNEYKIKVYLPNKTEEKIQRSTGLPEKYLTILTECGLKIFTYGELTFLNKINPAPDNVKLAFDKLYEIGFKSEILERVI